MTRVLLVSPSAMPGGAERALASLARHLPPFGLEPQAVLLQDGPLVGWLEEAGCPVVQIPAGRMRQIPRALCTVQKLRRVMRLGKARVVVSNMEKGHIYGGLAALGEGIPAVWWQQGIPEGGGRFQLLAARVRAACVVCSCEEAVAAQRRLTPRLRVSKVHLGSAVDQIRSRRGSGRAVRARLGWDDNPIVGIVGRLQPWKGQAVFLRAAAQVASVRPDARFLVVGGAILGWEGDYPAELYRLAAELGLKGRVHFAGHQSDVYPWFDALDVVVHASEGEPFGLVLVEALALGKPLVATAAGGPLEIIEDCVSGLLVPVGDDNRMAQAVLSVLCDPVLAVRLREGAEARSELFSEERMTAAFAAVLEQVMESQ